MQRLEREGRTMWMKRLLDRVTARVGPGAGVSRRAGPVLLLAAAAAVVTTGGGVVAAALVADPRESPGPPGPRVSRPAGVAAAELPAPAWLGRSVPVRVTIPAIGVDATVVPVGLAGGDLAAPPDPALAGWYEQGTSPGEPGSAVIVGRVALPDPVGTAAPARPEPPGLRPGPPVFARLDRLRPGDGVRVHRADGSVASFSVDRTERYSSREVGVDPGGGAQLRLVPAAGPGVDRGRHVVVFATFVP